jgi:hypothetical protein
MKCDQGEPWLTVEACEVVRSIVEAAKAVIEVFLIATGASSARGVKEARKVDPISERNQRKSDHNDSGRARNAPRHDGEPRAPTLVRDQCVMRSRMGKIEARHGNPGVSAHRGRTS